MFELSSVPNNAARPTVRFRGFSSHSSSPDTSKTTRHTRPHRASLSLPVPGVVPQGRDEAGLAPFCACRLSEVSSLNSQLRRRQPVAQSGEENGILPCSSFPPISSVKWPSFPVSVPSRGNGKRTARTCVKSGKSPLLPLFTHLRGLRIKRIKGGLIRLIRNLVRWKI